MFNLFGLPNRQEKISNYPAVVEEIHNEFFTAGDRLLKEANEILAAAPAASIEKGKRLSALGFKNVPEAVNVDKVERQIEISKEVVELVRYYQVNYPNNKFITEEQVKAICEKYGLVCGEISMYKGFVPERKLSIIESFSLKESDKPYLSVFDYDSNFIGVILESDCDPSLITYFNSENSLNNIYITGDKGRKVGYSFDTPKYEKYKHLEFVKAFKGGAGLKICAPLKDMEIPSGKQVNGYKIQDIPDPVVLQPVNGGYLIVAAWGDEASDEIVVNQIHN